MVLLAKREVTERTAQNHGYNNSLPEMKGIFIAHGPFAKRARERSHSIRLNRNGRGPNGWELVNGTELVIPEFDNTQIYSLLARLLGLER